jgi:hypothetical protein
MTQLVAHFREHLRQGTLHEFPSLLMVDDAAASGRSSPGRTVPATEEGYTPSPPR